MKNVYLQGFKTLIYWNGGFYHKFTNCRFEKANRVIDNAYINNMTFINCRTLRIDTLVQSNAGGNPLVAIGCAFEEWTTTLFVSTAPVTQLVLLGCYIENYPTTAAGNGLAKDYFDTAFVASGFCGYTLIGNTFTTGGIRRIINNSGVDTDSIISLGNHINYQGDANDCLERAYMFANLKSAQMNDYAKNTLTGLTGGYTSIYTYGTYLYPEKCKVFDPFTNKDISPEIPWINLTLLNGWVQNITAGNNTISYRKIGNTIYLKGVIDGSAATANTMFNIPITTTKISWRNTSAVGATVNYNTRIMTTGDVRCETMAVNGIILDGLKYDII
jgi:hypothetical protein